MPLPIHLAHRLVENHAKLRRNGELKFVRPDAKSQVTIEYEADGAPHRIHTVVLSTQHDESAMEKRTARRSSRQGTSDHRREVDSADAQGRVARPHEGRHFAGVAGHVARTRSTRITFAVTSTRRVTSSAAGRTAIAV